MEIGPEPQDNNAHLRTIDILREENGKLKEEISLLKSLIQKQNDKMQSLELQVTDMKESYSDDKIIHKLGLVIQDVNCCHSLEQGQFRRPLKNIRFARNGECQNGKYHYILNDDSEEFRLYKESLIRDKLEKLSTRLVNKFENEYKGQGLINYIKNLLPLSANIKNLSEDDIEDANDWLWK